MFGTFATPFQPQHATYGPAMGDSIVEHRVGARGYDGGLHNSPFTEGRIKEPFTAPGSYNPFMFMRPRRRRLNLLSIIQVMSLPFVVFAMNCYLFGFSPRNTASSWCWAFVGFCILLSVVFLIKAFIVWRKQREETWTVPWYLLNDDDTWFLFLAASIALSCLLGACVGDIIYGGYTEQFYRLSLLHTYNNVDPVAPGKAYLDAGAVDFKNASFVDVSHGIGYKDSSVYCVAPITLGTDAVASWDFFAVGIDCCNGFPGNFNCFENRQDSMAHGGIRMVNDATLPYFKLAATQADAEWTKSSPNPIFLTWVRDPAQKIQSLWHDAVWTYSLALVTFVLFEMAAVGLMAYIYWKNRLWG